MLALTQSDVAETLEIGQKRVSEMERGQVDRTKVDTRRRYADALGDTLRVETQIGDETNKIARSSGSKDRPGDWSIVPA